MTVMDEPNEDESWNWWGLVGWSIVGVTGLVVAAYVAFAVGLTFFGSSPSRPVHDVDSIDELYDIDGRALECHDATHTETIEREDATVRKCRWTEVDLPDRPPMQVFLEFTRYDQGPWKVSSRSRAE